MEIKRICAVYWSATGNSKKTAEFITNCLALELNVPKKILDLTLPQNRTAAVTFETSNLVVVVTPTYAGKVPNKLLPCLQTQLQGNAALSIPIVTYGNRSYDHALAELAATLQNNHFRIVAAGAFVGRHAFTDALAADRPNPSDEMEMKNFAMQIAHKLRSSADVLEPVFIPGDANAPYYVPKKADGQPARFLKAKPNTDLSKCTNCKSCARQCPMGAIDAENPANVPGTCIKCQRCIRTCHVHAKYFDDEAFLSHIAMLEKNFSNAQKNEVFL